MSGKITKEQLLENAVKAKYGPRSRLRKTFQTENSLNRMWETFELSNLEPKSGNITPQEVGRRTVDIISKEYTNWGSEKEVSSITISKTSETESSTFADWTTTKGVVFGTNDIGANIMALAAMVPVGGSIGLGGSFSKKKTYSRRIGQSSYDTFTISHSQGENISVPPRTKVTATITTYSVTYRLEYVVEFKCRADTFIPVTYGAPLQGCCRELEDLVGLIGCCSQPGVITAVELFRPLPGFRQVDDYVFISQEGVLSWVGEEVKVDKQEQALS